jgi:hypothetical protein
VKPITCSTHDVVTADGQQRVEQIRTKCAEQILTELATTDLDTMLPNTISPAFANKVIASK